MAATLAELAKLFDCELDGPAELVVDTVGTLAGAGPSAVTFLANPAYRDRLAAVRAGAVVLAEPDRGHCPVAALVTENPYATYARIAAFLHPARRPNPGIDPTAAVARDAFVPDSAEVGAHVSIGPGAVLGEGVLIGPGSVIGPGARIGEGSRLLARVSVLDRSVLGARCIVQPGAVIGADGFGFARDGGAWVKIPQLGRVVIGDDVEIGANTAIDRGTIEDTVIGDGVKLDNLIQVAHNVRIGEHTVVAGCAGIAGSTRIGKRCMIGGAVKIVGHIEICDDVMIGFHATVIRSIATPGEYAGSFPAEEAGRWRRLIARFRRLDSYVERLRGLEQGDAPRSDGARKKGGAND